METFLIEIPTIVESKEMMNMENNAWFPNRRSFVGHAQ